MKIAITADVHLKKHNETPERYRALENIFEKIRQSGIEYLIIAGDLFDRDFSNYADFDSLCKNFPSIKISIIPGNHDYQISNKLFVASNIEVLNEAKIREVEGMSILFIPYNPKNSMDEVLSEFAHEETIPERWILIGHGDYITGNRELNPYEPGFYMPLTTKAILRHNPLRVFLGHIHKPSDFGRVFYPGSPCGLDITETGKRRFLVYDTIADHVEGIIVNTDKIYFNETITLLPLEEQEDFINKKIIQMVEGWNVNQQELSKASVRLSLKGYVRDLRETMEIFLNILSNTGINLYEKDGLDISEIKILKEIDSDRLYLLEKVKEKMEKIEISNQQAPREKILQKAMELIFSD